MANTVTLVAATQTLTSTGAFTDTQTVVIGGKTYTTQTTLTDTDGHVLIGADQTATHQNLLDAINLTGTAGTQYATSMTKNTDVWATSATATTTVIQAGIAGTIGNHIATTETQTNASWGAATLAGGSGDLDSWLESLKTINSINSEVLRELHDVGARVD